MSSQSDHKMMGKARTPNQFCQATMMPAKEPTPVSVKEAAGSDMRFGPGLLRIMVSFGVLVGYLSFPSKRTWSMMRIQSPAV